MKDLFPGYFPKTGTELEALWTSDETLFVFDTNILLGLYRYTPTTKDAFLNTLDKIKERVWLPYQIAEEYLRNRASVIHEEAESYSTLLKQIEGVRTSLNNQRKNPFITDETLTQANTLFDQLKTELDEGKKEFTKRYHDDAILDKISSLFEGKVGKNGDSKQSDKWIEQGVYRVNQQIPPGFADKKKLNEAPTIKDKIDALGDYVFWMQIINHAKSKKNNVVLVTDDTKQDWWHRTEDKNWTFGPRSELILEFRASVPERDIFICQSNKFLQLSNEYLDTEIEEDVISEVELTGGISFDEARKIASNMRSKMFNMGLDFQEHSFQEQQVLKADFEDQLDNDMMVDQMKTHIFSVSHDIEGLDIEKQRLIHRLGSEKVSHSKSHYLKGRIEEVDIELSNKRNQLKAFQELLSDYIKQNYPDWN
ncbi:PIN-like domain-containing protein [Celerinatantimonas sp. MCCC 1A17872]|uniref:PIN-like domain-containing protein n=1 Tax=Celerinatantimonas sp. MCCC 1A17872 TaxID=3177514 RepID=UPI0038C41CCB